ncbi:MAG: 2-phospho-L-lactate guanylyltransferase [Candidatus Thermofonsia Clade 1 bacterium]|jgi:2-phospho-L-lactate guanylyltransferase|uniref:Phosphoenolpyruvate guanylyltransferase n=1 Tax=Candidatus Thermofonsia Clade 1 bacterium TaxID=2364210 RepID=A0A2M8PCL6_9CHLR|nr:MAG: 2-phospho-L-lactate guanylyltransferase [Candidatus Thermofonsia Clade 1 bacterium]RMF50634.1 MAG: 2-phospho-L-lactate guanylyltransferase [Chloroflexota bacterium]
MTTWAIVPVKPFVRAKSRLASVLTPEQREALAERMLRHGLAILSNVPAITGLMVISRDGRVLAIAREYGAQTVQESGTPELNAALMRATELARLRGASSVLVVPADLPLYTVQDIEEVLQLGRYSRTVVLVPDRNEDGTNAMLVNPPALIPYSFGAGSFQRHCELAQQHGATLKVHRSEHLSIDIDTPSDLAFLEEQLGGFSYAR